MEPLTRKPTKQLILERCRDHHYHTELKMDYWAENQGHLTEYNKFNTVPSRSCTQNYHDRQPVPQFPIYYGDKPHKTIHSGYWPSRDVPNWTNQESTNMTSSQNFPFSFGHPVQRHYSDVGEQQRQEARDWATYQLQQERGMQREGWSYNPAHCKRDLARKNESNFRELEAWALRYSHSLPRRRRIEAELRGARQDNIEKRDMQMQCIQDSTQWDRASRQQAPNYCQTTPASPSFDVKDRLSCPTKLYSHPPNYNAPPSYSVQFRSVSALHKFENQNKLQREVSEKCPSKVVTEELETLQVNRPLVQGRPSNEAAKVIEGRKFRLNKKAGGMTIFCLVSRIADTERESLPVSQKQSDAVQPKSTNVSQPLKLADEVDFKVQTPTKHARSPYSKLQAIPICQESLSKMVEKNVEKKVSAFEKLQSKYPLWRRPSNTSHIESDNAFETCLKDISDSNLQDEENGTKSSQNKESVQEAQDDAKLMIDTTCVVVKMEVLQGPKKEKVHYVGADNQSAQGNHDNPTNQLDIGLAEDFKTLPEQEANGVVDEKAHTENVLPGNSNPVSESLEERAKRICGLHDSTMIPPQGEDVFELGVDVFPKKNASTNDFERAINQEELQNVFTKSKTEHLQPEIVSICKDEVIGEAGVSTENIKENGNGLEEDLKVQISKMADNLEQESNGEEALSGQCEEPVEIDQCTDALDNLALSGEERDNEVLPTKYDSPLHDSLQNGEGLVEVDADTQVLDVYENNTMPSSLIGANNGILSDDSKDKNQDQEATAKVIEGDFEQQNIVEKLVNSNLGELSNLELESSQRDEVSRSNDGEKHSDEMVQVSAIETLQQLDSGQVEDMPALEILSESEQKLKANDEMDRGNAVESECELKAGVCCMNEDIKNSNKDMDDATSDLEIQEIAEKVIEVHDMKGGERNAIKDTTCSKERSAAMEHLHLHLQADILAASNFTDQEQETQQDLSDDLKEDFQFGCHEKALVKEEGLYDEENIEKKLSSVDVHEKQDDKPPPVKDTQVETPSEDDEQRHDIEDIDNVNEKGPEDQAPSEDVSGTDGTNSYSEMCEEVGLQNNTEDDQEEDEMCTKHSKTLEAISEKADTLEKLHDDEKVEINESVQVQEIAVATCVKEEPEDTAFLVGDDERGKEPKTQKDTDLQGQILEEIGFIDASRFKVQDFDLQPCEWEDATSKSSANEEELIKDNGKSNQDTRICQSTNKDISEISLVCNPNPIINNNAAILDRSSSSMDPSMKSVPPTSTCNSNFENASCGEAEKYPKSLWDAVSRIRKHTAPDSENEEEEVTDSWDRESFADNIVDYEHVFEQGYIDITEGMQTDPYYEGLNMQDDTLSQCSNSSQGSDGTIVDDELEALSNTESKAICIENQGCDAEEKCENGSN